MSDNMSEIKFNIKEMIRSNCEGFEPYVAGRPIEAIKKEFNLNKVIKLASNENPLGPSKFALSVMKKVLDKVYFYPDSNSFELKQAISNKYDMPCSQITVGAGSDEIIELIAKVFFHPADEIVISEHAFIRYQMAGLLMGCKLIIVPMKEYTHDLAAMAEAVTERTKAIFIANPNNPTGTYNVSEEFETFLHDVKARSAGNAPLVVVDEAYYEYAKDEKDYPETIGYIKNFPNLIILRTFSKIYGLAGLRVGYGFASEDVIDYIERVRPPFNVNLIAQVAAAVSLEDEGQVLKSLSLSEEGKKYFYSELKDLGVSYVPSAANFVLIDVSPRKGSDVFKSLLKSGVIVRAMDEYNFPNHIRVTVGLPGENKEFFHCFKEIIKKR